VLGNTLWPAAQLSLIRRLGKDGADAEQMLADTTARATEIATRFPRLRERIHTHGAGYAATPERTFEFGLKAILDGFETHPRRSRP